MLSIAPIESSAKASHYYEKDDYYLQGTKEGPQGEWYGKGAESLGLSGGVEAQTFVALLDGVLPNGQIIGGAQRAKQGHTPGWDLTFSAPKSVSIMAEVGKDERLFEAHQAAVKEALDWMEEHAAGVRLRSAIGRLFKRTQSLVVALFMHHTSRNQDPDLHTHSVVPNASEKMPAEFRALYSQMLFESKMTGGVIYRAALARRVLELGYDIEITHDDGRFEIVGVPPELVRLLSTRRAEVESILERWGRDDPESAARATLLSRQRKQAVSRDELQRRWQSAVDARGFDIEALKQQAQQSPPRPAPPGVEVHTALKDAIDRLSEAEAEFSHPDLVRHTMALLVGRATVEQVEQAIRRAEGDRRLLRVDEAGREEWTTPAALMRERYVLDAVERGKGQMRALFSGPRLQRALDEFALNAEQRQAVELILTSKDRFVSIQGLPGTGKTSYVLKTVRELAERRNVQLVGMAQNAEAARTLRKDAGIPTSTIHRHLRRVGQDVAAAWRSDSWQAHVVRFRYRRQVWVVDEAAQLPANLERQLTVAVEKLGVRLLTIGDTGQLAAIEAGKLFKLKLDRGVQYAELTNMNRQRNPEHLAAVLDARAGRVQAALDRLQDSIYETEDRTQRLGQMLETYRGMSPEERSKTLMLTARNAEKRLLNEGVRQIRLEEGEIQGSVSREQLVKVFSRSADRRRATFYKAGYIVRFARPIEYLGIQKDEYWKVAGINPKTNEVTLSGIEQRDGERAVWNPRKVGASNKKATEIYKLEKTELAVDEPVSWGRNSLEKYGLVNRQMLRSVRVDAHTTTFEDEDGKQITVDHRSMAGKHWDHAYASTVYSSQGRTIHTILVNAESYLRELFSQAAFVVAISRQTHVIKLFTDNTKELAKTLRRYLGQKTSAIEAMEDSERANRALELERIREQARQSQVNALPQPQPPLGFER